MKPIPSALQAEVAAPVIWNCLPSALRSCQTVLTFRKHLKTHYFNYFNG